MNIHWISSLRRLLPISSFSRSEKDENFDSEWKKDSSRPTGCIKIELNSNQKIIVAIDNFLSFFLHEDIAEGCGQVREGEKSIAVSGGHTPWLPSVHSHTPCWAGWRVWGGG